MTVVVSRRSTEIVTKNAILISGHRGHVANCKNNENDAIIKRGSLSAPRDQRRDPGYDHPMSNKLPGFLPGQMR